MFSRAFAAFLMTAGLCISAQSPDSQQVQGSKQLQSGYCPNTHQLEDVPSQEFFFEGAIGRRHVRMYLDRGGSGVVGLFFDRDDWSITQFGGTWNNGEIEASDGTDTDPPTGHLKASLADKRLIGTWTAVEGKQSQPVDLLIIPEPKCNGEGKWKHFDDPAYSVSFSYPGSWHLSESKDGILLTCPNPSAIAFSENLWIKVGTGRLNDPTGPRQCGDKWIYPSDCDCNHSEEAGCRVANAIRHRSATVLDVSDHEWRVYCYEGGYVGQGDGQDFVVLLSHHWLEFISNGGSGGVIERMIATLREHPPKEAK